LAENNDDDNDDKLKFSLCHEEVRESEGIAPPFLI
jgi:hypothetical protein